MTEAARNAPDEPVELAVLPPLEDAVPRIERLGRTLFRFRAMQTDVDKLQATATMSSKVSPSTRLARWSQSKTSSHGY